MSKPDLSTYGGKLHDAGVAGQAADFNPSTIESKLNNNATSIDFGVAVCRSTTDDTCKPQLLDADPILGISVRSPTQIADPTTGEIVYKQNQVVPIMRQGYIYAKAFENTVRGDDVIAVTAQTGKLGSETGGAAGVGRIVVPGATWETTTTAGDVGLIRIS
jgi:hypothetical protein